jgi:hypothetical protein
MARKYYPARKGNEPLTLEVLKTTFAAAYQQLDDNGYFAESLGIASEFGRSRGLLGDNPDIYFVRHLRKKRLWPIVENLHFYSEDDLFGVIELLYDLASKPLGMAWEHFDRAAGRILYRAEMNDILSDYKNGFQLNPDGEIVEKVDAGLEFLVSAELPQSVEDEIKQKVRDAVALYRSRNSSLSDRHNAVRMLADVFEKFRPELQKAITKKDEGDLFNIANNFAIRHNNDTQKADYDKALCWRGCSIST